MEIYQKACFFQQFSNFTHLDPVFAKLMTPIILYRFDRYQCECTVPWVNDVLLLLTVALQTGEHLKDKMDILCQYKQEININKTA